MITFIEILVTSKTFSYHWGTVHQISGTLHWRRLIKYICSWTM